MAQADFERLLEEVPQLTSIERGKLYSALREAELKSRTPPTTEDEFLEYLESSGKITRAKRPGPIPDYKPLKIPGRPLSEDIIEGRGPR